MLLRSKISDELKKVQKDEFLAGFHKLYDSAKVCIYANGAYFELKRGMCLSHLSSVHKKKSVLKLLDRTV